VPELTGDIDSRADILGLLRGERPDRVPCFSGMGNVTTAGMEKHGIRFANVHRSAEEMAKLSATSYELFGYECAVAPYDLGIEAEVLGAKMNYYDHLTDNILFPTVTEKSVKGADDIILPDDIASAGRIPMMSKVFGNLKGGVGRDVPIGSYVLGPFTLAGQVMDLNDLLKSSLKEPERIDAILERLVEVLDAIVRAYFDAGIDYISIREMGAPADVISPRIFKKTVQPHLVELIGRIARPKVLHICGNTLPILPMMAECGADAVSFDQKVDAAEARKLLGPDVLLFGNMDPYAVLVEGKPDDVRASVKKSIDGGVDALWPGCDIWPTVPAENFKAMVEATHEYGVKRGN